MPYRIFAVSSVAPDEALAELNQFLSSHRVVEVDKRFHADGPIVSWHFCVTFAVRGAESSGNRSGSRFSGVDYKERLSDDDFEVFSQLRDVRKQLAEERSIQLFTILTNKQLAEMAKRRVTTMSELRAIDGIGEKKATAFGKRFLAAIRKVEPTTHHDDPPATENKPNSLFEDS